MECIIAGAVAVGFVAVDEAVKHLCRQYLKQKGSNKVPDHGDGKL